MILSSSVAIVTGGGTGVGRATALALARKSAKVLVMGRRKEPLEETVRMIIAQGGEALACPGDVTKAEDVSGAVRAARDRWGTVDILVNNAGVLPWGDIAEGLYPDFDRVIETNYLGAVRMTLEVLPILREKKRGVVVNVSSILGKVPSKSSGAYAASKHALAGFTEALRLEQGANGIHVVGVYPGLIDTPMTERFFNEDPSYRKRATSPDRVGAAIVRAMEKGRREVMIPWYVKPAVVGYNIAPRISDWIIETFA